MSYRVRIESFEGPFDLLLYLVNRQKVDIGSISITEITDQYLAEVQRMSRVDLDVASDFLLVAATLLEIKAASLIPSENEEEVQEYEDLSPYEMRDMLVAHLFEYKKFKNAASALQMRYEAEGRMHVRTFGPDCSFLKVMPDYLKNVTLEKLGAICASIFSRQDVFLLESEHIAARVIPVEEQIEMLYTRVKKEKRVRFSDVVSAGDSSAVIVVTFLATLELYKRSMVSLSQDELFGDIVITFLEGSPELIIHNETFDSVEE